MGKFFYFIWRLTPFYWYSLIRDQKKPADTSNRLWTPILLWIVCTRYNQVCTLTGWDIGYFRMVWRATTREDLFVPYMPFLKYDLWVLLVEHVKNLDEYLKRFDRHK